MYFFCIFIGENKLSFLLKGPVIKLTVILFFPRTYIGTVLAYLNRYEKEVIL